MFRKFLFPLIAIASLALTSCGRLDDNMEAMGEKMTGGECSWSRYVDGKDFCRHDKSEAVAQEPLYCYQSFGTIECFLEPQAGRSLYVMGEQPVSKPADTIQRSSGSE